MGYSHYERLRAVDATFLEIEDGNAHMHIGAIALFEAGPLTREDGSVEIDRIRALMEAGIHRIPRYRQRLAWSPVFGHPVWVDDERFNLSYHLRHTSLPRPGTERLLKRLAGRIMSQPLERHKPLWEMWVVEGVEGGRLAVITKAHHCLVDGVGSVELMGSVIRPTEEQCRMVEAGAPRWVPRPAPGRGALLLAELAQRVREPFVLLRGLGEALADPAAALEGLRGRVAAIGEALSAELHSASATPLNVDIGPYRRFDWTESRLDDVKRVRDRLGGTVNDVVLAVLSGALRRFLHHRGLRGEQLDFRAMIPVNLRAEEERGELGNRVTMMVARLPLGEAHPARRLQRVTETTRELKGSAQALGVRTLEEVSEHALSSLFFEFARLTATIRPFNVVVTNVPGPPFKVELLGAPMQAVYPVVPLYRNQALGVALFSYAGRLFWGFNADWDAVPDLHELVDAVDDEFLLLCSAAGGAVATGSAAADAMRSVS